MKGTRYNNQEDIDGLPPWRLKLHDIIFGDGTGTARVFDLILLGGIVLSVVAVMLESVKDINAIYGRELLIIEWVFTVLFTLEYVARIISVGHPWKYIFSFMGLVDLLAIIPTYLSFFVTGTQSLLVIRSIRLLRVFRILKLYRYVSGARVMIDGLIASRFKIIIFLGSVLTLTTIMGTVMYLIEHGENGFDSIPRSIYWAIVTLTTVGYGDIAPQTVIGQMLASMVMIMGYAIIAVPAGIVTAEIIRGQRTKPGSKQLECPGCNSNNIEVSDNFCCCCGKKL